MITLRYCFFQTQSQNQSSFVVEDGKDVGRNQTVACSTS